MSNARPNSEFGGRWAISAYACETRGLRSGRGRSARLPGANVGSAAVVRAAAYPDHLFPLLLVLKCATRASALTLLGMAAVVQIFA